MMIRVRQWCTARWAILLTDQLGALTARFSRAPLETLDHAGNDDSLSRVMVEGGEITGGKATESSGPSAAETTPPVHAVPLTRTRPHAAGRRGMRALMPGQVHRDKYVPSSSDFTGRGGPRSTVPGAADVPRPAYRAFTAATPGRAPVHAHQHPGRAARQRRSPVPGSRAEPAHAGIDTTEVRPWSRSGVTHPGLGKSRWLPLRPPGRRTRARLTSVSGTVRV